MTKRFATSLTPPYYAVIFSSQHTGQDGEAYGRMAARMEELAKEMPGYLGIESTRDEAGFAITVSYWENEEAIRAWKAKTEHLAAQEKGKRDWYDHYELRVAKVERAYSGPEGR